MSRQLKPQAATAEHALARCRDEPGFEALLRAAYRGRHDVLDALWWAAHPLTASPRGVADPASSLRELQRSVFSRVTGESPTVEVIDPGTGATLRIRASEHRLREAERLLADDAQQLMDALGTLGLTPAPVAEGTDQPAELRERETPPAPIEASVRRPDQPTRPDIEPPAAGALESEGFSVAARPRAKILLPALAGMGLLSVILLVPTLSELNAGADGESSPSSTTPPRISTEIVTLGATGNVPEPLAVLERPQEASDRPPVEFPTSLPAESFRALPEMVAHVRLYLTRGSDPDSICLVVVQPDNLGMSGCMPESNFVDDGIQLSGGRYEINDQMTILTESYSLLPSGEFRYDATARVRGMPAPSVGSPLEEGPPA